MIAGSGETLDFSVFPPLVGDGFLATEAPLPEVQDVFVDASGNVYVVSQGMIRKIGADGIIGTVAGSFSLGFAGDGGLAAGARFASPQSIFLDGQANFYIADTFNHRVRRILSTDGPVAAGLVAAPAEPDFGTVAIGSSTQLVISITNATPSFSYSRRN
jgi:hypothetical protein